MSNQKITLNKPALILLYGYPGSGKTFFARQLADAINLAHIEGDRIRHELFEQPQHDRQENMIVNHLMEYMAETFLQAGMSVIYDTNAMRLAQRRVLRDIARKMKAVPILVWFQVDAESALYRASKRDHRKADDKYAVTMTQELFDAYAQAMQNPQNEDYMVISGKHTFNTHFSNSIW
jgi:predicted kinase